jgi:beta-lactamase class A
MTDLDATWATHLAPFDAAWEVRLGPEVLAAKDPNRFFSGASMIKTFIAALVSEDLENPIAKRSGVIEIPRHIQAEGDGLLRFTELPTELTIDQLLMLMIAVSDNTATTALVERLGGVEAVNTRLAARGWDSRVWLYAGQGDGKFSSVSLAEHQAALASITDPAIRVMFRAQQDRRSLARWLEFDAPFEHKTGTTEGVRHDAGVLQTERGELWVGAFTDGGPEAEYVDHPACIAIGAAMRDTLRALGLSALLATQP